jgi:hypothetical protein
MPTTKPRLNVTLTPESRAALERLTEASGIAASQFISRIVHDAIPVIDATAKAMKMAKANPHRATELMHEVLTEAQSEMGQVQIEFEEQRKKLRRRPSR